MPAPESKRAGPAAVLAARLRAHVRLELYADGAIVACFDRFSIDLGRFGKGATDRARALRAGLPVTSFGTGKTRKETELLVRELARHGLLEYRLGDRRGADRVIIEPQSPDYWPAIAPLAPTDTVVLSRFAYLRRRGTDMVLESPRAGASFKICDAKLASFLAMLSRPRQIKSMRAGGGFPGLECLGLLLECEILFKVAGSRLGLRTEEGDHDLVVWDFHDLLFHTRSTEGRHANPLGGLYPHAGLLAPLPAVRPSWPGKQIELAQLSGETSAAIGPVAKFLRQRHSTRSFDDAHPITLAELARWLDGAARILARSDLGDGGHTVRPYPSAGAEYELELYLAVDRCEGLDRGYYHYDAGTHALVLVAGVTPEFDALLERAARAMGAAAPPQVLITIAARFGRIAWKYSSIAYSLILKDVGVLTQNLYLMATDLDLGACAIGIANIDLFAKITGIAFYVEGAVGQFAIGRGKAPTSADHA